MVVTQGLRRGAFIAVMLSSALLATACESNRATTTVAQPAPQAQPAPPPPAPARAPMVRG